MIIKKILESYIDISDPKEMFSNDKESMLINKLTEKFVGICYMSCYIIKINKIIRRSYIYMNDTLNGDSHISIMFEVDAIIYNTNEIINGCLIIKKELNGIIHGKSEYAGIQISTQPNMSIFKEGDIVPVIVKRVRYNINQSSVSVLAMPFIPIKPELIRYNITDTINKNQIIELNNLITQIKTDTEKNNKLSSSDKKIYNFFNDLLSQKISKPDKHIKKINITQILELKSCIIYKLENVFDDPFVYYESSDSDKKDSKTKDSDKKDSSISNGFLYEKSESTKPSSVSTPDINSVVINESSYIAMYSILIKHLNNIQILNNFLRYYSTFELVQKNKDVWKMYSMLKN